MSANLIFYKSNKIYVPNYNFDNPDDFFCKKVKDIFNELLEQTKDNIFDAEIKIYFKDNGTNETSFKYHGNKIFINEFKKRIDQKFNIADI